MSDWTTVQIGDGIEIDLHYDLDSFPAVIRSGDNYITLSKIEVKELASILKVFWSVNEDTWHKYLLKLNNAES